MVARSMRGTTPSGARTCADRAWGSPGCMHAPARGRGAARRSARVSALGGGERAGGRNRGNREYSWWASGREEGGARLAGGRGVLEYSQWASGQAGGGAMWGSTTMEAHGGAASERGVYGTACPDGPVPYGTACPDGPVPCQSGADGAALGPGARRGRGEPPSWCRWSRGEPQSRCRCGRGEPRHPCEAATRGRSQRVAMTTCALKGSEGERTAWRAWQQRRTGPGRECVRQGYSRGTLGVL
jgi:hypothetical protein